MHALVLPESEAVARLTPKRHSLMPLRIRLIPFAPAPVRRLARLAGALLALVAAAGRAGAQTPEQPVP
ncbi:MAG: hypothetical protein H0V06_00810, partial [Gemmatimonadetes bacterium]|nr:hypothetical protein [Gemmatimonadota bacterium]